MERITYTNPQGVSFEFSEDILISLNGLGDVEADNQRQQSPFQDGSTYIDSLVGERVVDINFVLRSDNYGGIIDKRRDVSKATNPKLGLGKLIYESDGYLRQIEAVAESAPIFPDGDGRNQQYQKGTLSFLCPDPYWKTPSIEEEPTFEGLFSFPFEGSFEMGIQRDERIIENDGDAPSPIQVEFYGPAENPRIENATTGEYIKVNQTLAEDEYMRIDTTSGKKNVVFVSPDGTERNVFNWIDLESTFFNLVLGENEIVYTAESDIQGAEVNIYWQKQYVNA